jgi:fructokinase
MTSLRLGVDLGGTKTEAVVLRVADDPRALPEVLARLRVPTGSEHGYDHIVRNTCALVQAVTKAAGLAAPPPVGVGMPGSATVDDAGRTVVKNSNTVCLNGRSFQADVAAALGLPVAFANDANCFALAEATFGAAAGARVVFGVIMGTGVGGGVVFAEASGALRVWDGAQGIAGEWGHIALEPVTGPACYCGRRGCVETFLAGPAIERAYQARTGRHVALADLAARAPADADAAAVLRETLEIYGRALAAVLCVLDPDVVVLGGGVSNLALLYSEGTAAVARWAFTDKLRTRIVKNALGDSAGVFGAALLPIAQAPGAAVRSEP